MRRHFVSAAVIVGLWCPLAHAQTPQPAHSGGPQAVEHPQGPPVAASPIVIEREGRLTIHAKEVPASVLFSAVSDKTGVRIIEGAPLGDVRLSIELEALGSEEALRRLVSPYDAFFFYGRPSTSNLPASLQTVWVYPRGQGSLVAPIDATTAVSTNEFIVATNDPNPIIRMEALQQLVERTDGGGPAVEALTRALQDPEEIVRVTAIDSAVNHGVELPEKDLSALAIADSSPHVRLRALKALFNSPQVRQVAESAMSDGNEEVRAMARRILEALAQPKGGR